MPRPANPPTRRWPRSDSAGGERVGRGGHWYATVPRWPRSSNHGLLASLLDPAPRRRPPRRILGGMVAAVAERGYAATTITDVVRHARVSRRTFYEHFADKEACFLAAYDAVSDAMLARSRARRRALASGWERDQSSACARTSRGSPSSRRSRACSPSTCCRPGRRRCPPPRGAAALRRLVRARSSAVRRRAGRPTPPPRSRSPARSTSSCSRLLEEERGAGAARRSRTRSPASSPPRWSASALAGGGADVNPGWVGHRVAARAGVEDGGLSVTWTMEIPPSMARLRPPASLGRCAQDTAAGASSPQGLGDQLVGAPAGGVVVGDRDHDHLLGAVLGGDRLEAGADRARACRRSCAAAPGRRRRSEARKRSGRLRRRDRDQPAAAQHRERHPRAGREPLRLLVGVGGQRPDRDRGARRAARAAARRSARGRARRSPRRAG